MMYWTKSPGIGGRILSQEDFIVDEIPHKKFLVKFDRIKGKVVPVEGPYFLYRLEKKGVTTKDAVKFVCRKYSLKEDDLGFAGLKDKFAITSQYITLKQKVDDFEASNISLKFVSPCRNMMSVGELDGNHFRITLHGCKKPENAEKTIAEIEKNGMPNYFGPQRFSKNNEKIGRLLVAGDLSKVMSLINSTEGKNFSDVRSIDKKMLKFYIHAYQSFVFNSVLDAYIAKNTKPFFGEIPIMGFETKLEKDFFSKESVKILEKDGVSCSDFRLQDLGLTCRGARRPAFVEVKRISCKIEKDMVVLDFELLKGSYATILIREISK